MLKYLEGNMTRFCEKYWNIWFVYLFKMMKGRIWWGEVPGAGLCQICVSAPPVERKHRRNIIAPNGPPAIYITSNISNIFQIYFKYTSSISSPPVEKHYCPYKWSPAYIFANISHFSFITRDHDHYDHVLNKDDSSWSSPQSKMTCYDHHVLDQDDFSWTSAQSKMTCEGIASCCLPAAAHNHTDCCCWNQSPQKM